MLEEEKTDSESSCLLFEKKSGYLKECIMFAEKTDSESSCSFFEKRKAVTQRKELRLQKI